MANIDSSEKRAEIINTWTAAPNVASAALQAELTEKIDPSDPKAADSRREVTLRDSFDQAIVFCRLAVAIRYAAGNGPADGRGLGKS